MEEGENLHRSLSPTFADNLQFREPAFKARAGCSRSLDHHRAFSSSREEDPRDKASPSWGVAQCPVIDQGLVMAIQLSPVRCAGVAQRARASSAMRCKKRDLSMVLSYSRMMRR